MSEDVEMQSVGESSGKSPAHPLSALQSATLYSVANGNVRQFWQGRSWRDMGCQPIAALRVLIAKGLAEWGPTVVGVRTAKLTEAGRAALSGPQRSEVTPHEGKGAA